MRLGSCNKRGGGAVVRASLSRHGGVVRVSG